MAFPLINIRFILLISASFIAIFSSIAIYFCLPILISHVIRTQITLSATSGSYNQWRVNSVIDYIYLYNITNLNDLIAQNELSAITNSPLLSVNTNETTTTGVPNRLATSSSNSRSLNKQRTVPILEEIGPFTFRQVREKLNIRFDKSNETVLYDQKKSWHYMSELSVDRASLEHMNSLWINHLNIPLIGTTLNAEYAEFIDPVIAENDMKVFLNHSVNQLLFEGYFDILMEQAKASGTIDVDHFGWMYNQNNSLTRGMRIFTGPSNASLGKFGLIDEFNHKRQFQIWHNNETKPADFRNVSCNQFRLSSPGEFFPPPEYSLISHNHFSHLYNSDRQDSSENNRSPEQLHNENNKQQQAQKSVSLFLPDLCRTLKLFYNGTHSHKGLQVDRYIANENTFKYVNNQHDDQNMFSQQQIDSNKCFCIYNETNQLLSCPPNGMMDLFHCRKGSPITISFPHFLYYENDPKLSPYLSQFRQQNIKTNQEDYKFFMDLEATLNVPVNVQIVLQFNVHFRNEHQLNFTKDYSYLFSVTGDGQNNETNSTETTTLDDFYLPQMWIKSRAEIDDANLQNLKFIQNHLGLVTPIVTIIIFACASILLTASAKLAYDLTYGPKSRKSLDCAESSCSSSNQTRLCSDYMDEKKKYLNMQLLAAENATNQSSSSASSSSSSSCTKSNAKSAAKFNPSNNRSCSGNSNKKSSSKLLKLPFVESNNTIIKGNQQKLTTSNKTSLSRTSEITNSDMTSNSKEATTEESQPLNG